MKKSHPFNALSTKVCETTKCNKRIKKRHEDTHTKCFPCQMRIVRNNPRYKIVKATPEISVN